MTSLYLDTSDLSYLLLGRLRRDSSRPERWRERLTELLRNGSVHLRVSPVHLAELALRPDLQQLGLAALETTPGVRLVLTSSIDVFRAELERRGPVTLVERPPMRDELRSVPVPTRWPRLAVSGSAMARFLKAMIRLETSASASSKRARSADAGHGRARDDKHVMGIMRGETEGIPWWLRPAVRTFGRVLPWVLERSGLTMETLERYLHQEPRGLGWAVLSTREGTLPARQGKAWKAEDAVGMPATVLRACVEEVHANPRRPADEGTSYDVAHLAYVAYSDFSTIDGANFDAVKRVMRLFPHLRVFRTGNLDPVLDRIEAET